MNKNAINGMISLGSLAILTLFASVVFLSFKLAPPYIENAFLQSGLKSLVKHPDGMANLSDQDIRLTLGKQLMVNGVETNLSNKLRVLREEGAVVISVKYEQRVPLVLNVSAVLNFENMIDSRFPDECCQSRQMDENLANQLR